MHLYIIVRVGEGFADLGVWYAQLEGEENGTTIYAFFGGCRCVGQVGRECVHERVDIGASRERGMNDGSRGVVILTEAPSCQEVVFCEL
jgi:hypothetical protein